MSSKLAQSTCKRENTNLITTITRKTMMQKWKILKPSPFSFCPTKLMNTWCKKNRKVKRKNNIDEQPHAHSNLSRAFFLPSISPLSHLLGLNSYFLFFFLTNPLFSPFSLPLQPYFLGRVLQCNCHLQGKGWGKIFLRWSSGLRFWGGYKLRIFFP